MVLPIAVFTAIATIQMGPAITHCGSTIVGGPGDATSGGVWLAWNYKRLGVGPWPAITPFTGAPFGEALWHPLFITAYLVLGPLWLLARVTNPVCAWNLSILSGFVLTACAMYALVRWLTHNSIAAYIAGYAYAFSPYAMIKAQGHLAYVHAELLPLLLLACFALWKRPTPRRALIAGVVVAALSYTDGYYILLGLEVFAVFEVAAFAYLIATRARWQDIRRYVAMVAIASTTAAVLMLPVASVAITQGSEIAGQLQRGRGDITLYSARLSEYVLPARSNPALSHLFGTWEDRHLHGSNFSEQTLFLGWTVILFALGYAVLAFRRRNEERVDSRFSVVVLGSIALVALFASGPPIVHIASISISTPSRVITHFFSFWRVYARFFLVVNLAVVVLAALGIAYVLHRTPKRHVIVAAAVAAAVVFESLTFPPRTVWSYAQAPAEYKWLAGQPVQTIAEYPPATPPLPLAFHYLTYQPVHQMRLINPSTSDSRAFHLMDGIYGLADTQTESVLRTLGATMIVVHGPPLATLPPLPPPAAFTAIQQFPDAAVYRIRPGPKAVIALTTQSGFLPAELHNDWTSFRWMGREGFLSVEQLTRRSPPKTADIGFDAVAFGPDRHVIVREGNRVVWDGIVPGSRPVHIAFVGRVDMTMRITTTPGAVSVHSLVPTATDDRSLSIGLSGMVATDRPGS